MNNQLIQISPLQRVLTPLNGLPTKREGDPNDWTNMPANHKYVPIVSIPAYDPVTHTVDRTLTTLEDGWTIRVLTAPELASATASEVQNNIGTSVRSESTADPSTTEYPNDKEGGVHYNSTSGKLFYCHNRLGTIYKIELT